MKTYRASGSVLALLLVTAAFSSHAQTIGRIRQSIDKATGGATAARPTPGTTTIQTSAAAAAANQQAAAQAAAQAQAQAAAADSLANKRNQAALVGADDRVVAFLKERIANGSADAAYDLAKRTEEGRGVVADPVEARRLYALAAERDNEDAKKWLEEHPALTESAPTTKPAVAKDAPAAKGAPAATVAIAKKPEADAKPAEKPAEKPADKPSPEAEKAKK